MVFHSDVIEGQRFDGRAGAHEDGFHGVDSLTAVKMLDADIFGVGVLLNVEEGEMVVRVLPHMYLLNGQAHRLGGVDVAEGDRIEAARGLSGVELRQTDAILIIRAVHIGDGDVANLMVHGQQANRAVAALGKDAVNLDVGDITA